MVAYLKLDQSKRVSILIELDFDIVWAVEVENRMAGNFELIFGELAR